MGQDERRVHARVSLTRPCKLYDPRLRKYVAGLTWNLSSSGAFLEVDRPLALSPGDHLFLGIAMKRRQGVLASTDMLEVEILRSMQATGNRTAMAIRFVDSREAAATAPRAAA
ncbi:MAG: PilZ domain-containing protein [Myxococcota bacterium]